MKPVFTSFNLKKTATVLASGLLLTLGSAKLQAAPIIEKIVSPADQLVSVNYVGSNENSVTFHLDFENKTGEKFWLIIKNNEGEIVYKNAFTDTHFEKNIRLTREENEMHPTFIIRTANDQVERKFSVDRKISENIVVTTL
jgi:hypothetical protein